MTITVLVVDDSLFMRKLIARMLSSDPDLQVVGTAKDGVEAIEKIFQLKPDVVTLDVNMPVQDGLTTLQKMMAQCPTPAVMISAHTRKDADITLACLDEGAVGYILKPSGELSLDIDSVRDALMKEVKAAAGVDVRGIAAARRRAAARLAVAPGRRPGRPPRPGEGRVVVIGASTGGPPTVEAILSRLPADFPLPGVGGPPTPSPFFSEGLAERLQRICRIDAKVAEEGDPLEAGTIYVVPSGFHLALQDDARIRLERDPPDVLSPSIDATMRWLAGSYHGRAIGVVLTGMGTDGRQGMEAIKGEGGVTLVQDEASSMIFGMPAAVIDAGLADKVLTPDEIAEELQALASLLHKP